MSYGRRSAGQSARGDPILTFAGAAVLLVGLCEAMIGFVFYTACAGYFDSVCIDQPSAAAGSILGLAGVVVLIGGALVYLLGRRAITR